jgi:hypothetical protein
LDAALETSTTGAPPVLTDGLSIVQIITEYKNAVNEFLQDNDEDMSFGDVKNAIIGEYKKNYPTEFD